MNLRDMAFKLFWTLANVGLAAAVVAVGDLEPAPAWGAVALAVLQLASTWVRQKVGATPPDAPTVEPFPLTKG